MKFSRNPISGTLESYSDDCIFAGPVFTMGDFITKDQSAQDGGPGSGNFGHKGRPGLVGGSGKGGGKQYRGGRSDIGYFGSRKDWLNGLSGEKQSNATKFMKKRKDELKDRLSAKKYLSNRPEEIKKLKLDRINENTSPEEYTMIFSGIPDKKELLDYVGEARSWDDRGMKLCEENLSAEERRNLNLLATNYWGDMSEEEVKNSNLDRIFDKLDLEEKNLYLDLKAKACGIPNSGEDINEYSDELLLKLGLITKMRLPQTAQGEDDNYKYSFTEEQRKKLKDAIEKTGHTLDFGSGLLYGRGGIKRAEIEMQYDLPDPKAIKNVREYLNIKDEIYGSIWDKSINGTENIGNLNEKQSKAVRDILNFYADTHPELKRDNLRDIEDAFLDDDKFYPSAKDYFLGLKFGALGAYSGDATMENKASSIQGYIIREKKKIEAENYSKESVKSFTDKDTRRERYKKEQEATTTEELMNIMKESKMFKKDGIIAIGALPVDVAKNIVVDPIERIMYRFPFLSGRLEGISVDYLSDSTYANCTMQTGRVRVNSKHYKSLYEINKEYDQNVADNFHPKGTNADSIVVHEFAHALDGYLTNKKILESSWASDARGFSGRLRANVLKSLKLHQKDVEAEVCEYATKNAYEWFAECMAEALCSPTPRRMATEAYRQLKQILEENGMTVQELL